MFSRELDEIRGAGSKSTRGREVLAAATGVFESLIADLLSEAHDERSRLRAELDAARVDVETFRLQLLAAQELAKLPNSSRRHPWLQVAYRSLGVFLLSVSANIATAEALPPLRSTEAAATCQHIEALIEQEIQLEQVANVQASHDETSQRERRYYEAPIREPSRRPERQ